MTTDQRLSRVERRCRLLTAAFALMTVALALVLLIGAGQDQGKPKVLEEVRAKRFVLVDEEAKVRMGLMATVYGPHLVLLNKAGTHRASLAIKEDGPGFSLLDKTGQRRVVLAVTEDGPVIEFKNKTGKVIFKAPK